MKREIVSIAVMLMLFVSMFLSLPLVSAAYTVEYPYMPPDLEGDVNNDGMVDMADISIVIDAFGSKPGDPNWDPRADVNNDGTVDMVDVTIVIDNFIESEGNPVAYSTTFEFTVPNDGNKEVWYYILAKVYVPPELSGQNFYFVASADDSVQNVKLDDVSKAGSGSSVNIDLGSLNSGYHLLEFEFVETIAAGVLNFHVATTAEEYAWLPRFRVYVPNYSDTEYRYTITTHTNFPMSDRYFIRGFADDYIDDIKLAGGWLYRDWQWESDWKTIYAWGDGFNVPCGYLDPPYWRDIELVYGVISGGVLDFQILSFTEQPEKIAKGTPEFWASVMANGPINMKMLYKKLYAGSEWYGEPGLSERKITVAQELCFARYAYAGGPLLWDAKARFDVGVEWLDWVIDSETSFGITINLTYLGGVEKPLGSVGISYVGITVRTPAQALGVLGWEFQDLHGGKSIVNSDFKIATSITVSAAAAYALTFALPVGAVVGIAATGAMVMGIFGYVEGTEEAPFEYHVHNDFWATASIDGMGTGGESVSEVLFIKVKPLQATHCGFVKVLVDGILEGIFVKTYIYFPVYVL